MFTLNGKQYNAIVSGKAPQVNDFIGIKHASKFKQSLTSEKNEGDLGRWMKEKSISLAKKDGLVKLLTYKTPKKQKSVKKKVKYQEPQTDKYLDKGFWDRKRWTNYLEAKARTNHHQRFGMEYEIKEIHISYKDTNPKFDQGDIFHDWARNCAHLIPIYTGKKDKGLQEKVEIHLDSTVHQDKHGGVLLEVVTGQLTLGEMATVMEWFRNSLVAIKTPEDYVAWLEYYFEPQTKAVIKLHDYIARNLTLTDAGKKWHASPQVTTTLTAKELLSLTSMPNFTPTGKGNPTLPEVSMSDYVAKRCNKNKDKNYGDEFIIQEYLGSMEQYGVVGMETELKTGSKEERGKGGRALIKHAAQQFSSYRATETDRIANDPIVDRLDPQLHTNYELLKLRTRANKIAPICKRPDGDIAYLIEFRGSCEPEGQLGLWFQKADKADPLTKSMLRTFFKNILPKHKEEAKMEEKEDPLKLDDYAKICQALGKSSK